MVGQLPTRGAMITIELIYSEEKGEMGHGRDTSHGWMTAFEYLASWFGQHMQCVGGVDNLIGMLLSIPSRVAS